MARGTRALIDLRALASNAAHLRRRCPGARIAAVVKADGYGHGAQRVAHTLASRVDAFAVATLAEAVELQDSGINLPILLLEGTHGSEQLPEVQRRGLWLALTSAEQVAELAHSTSAQPIVCWLKIDTGMHRLGIAPEQARALLEGIISSGLVAEPPVLFSHYACADEPTHPANDDQERCFEAAIRGLEAPRSLANSAAILTGRATTLDWVRPGYMLFGGNPLPPDHAVEDAPSAVMTFESRIIALRNIREGEGVGYGHRWRARRPSRIATVAVGYADGYPRTARDGTPLLIRGQRAPLAGRVSMDMITVDVTDIGGVRVGDPVVLWGQDLGVDEVAGWCDTIGYALMTGVSRRVPRIYRGDATPESRGSADSAQA